MFPSSSTVSSMNGMSISPLLVEDFFIPPPPRRTFSGGAFASLELDFPSGACSCISKLFRVGSFDKPVSEVVLFVPGVE